VRIIVGIGNPGSRYKLNRHNVGFQFLDYFAQKKSLRFKPSKSDYYFAEGIIDNNPFLLIKPSSYVNNSGIPVLSSVEKYKILLSDLLIVIDDINIPISSIRLRKSGGDGGHNGLGSIIYHLNSQDFPRLRIGIGKELTDVNLPDFILSDFEENEFEILKKSFVLSSVLVEEFITDGFQRMLNSYSKLIKSEKLNGNPD
jgi:PTH1 family peptidyl-tRNA hydrolase